MCYYNNCKEQLGNGLIIKVKKEVKKMEDKKVWCFNCYGVCIKRMYISEIESWNEKHGLVSDKITSWKE